MYRFTLVFSSLLLVAVWSAPIDAAAEQRRARRRDSGTTQTQRAPQRTAPARRAPAARQQRGGRDGGSARRAVPRRAPRPSTGSGRVERERRRGTAGRTRGTGGRQVAPPTNERRSRARMPRGNSAGTGTAVRRRSRPDNRVTTAGRDPRGRGSTPRGSSVRTGTAMRRPSRPDNRVTTAGRDRSGRGAPRVVGTAVPRAPLSSRPIIIDNYDGRGRGYVRGYTPYRGRHRYGAPHIYGSHFYFPGYSTFNIGFGRGYGSSYGYNPYGFGLYGSSYGYNRYGYGHYGYTYGYSPYAYGGYADSYYTGSLRLKVEPRFGEVFVDGYYVGLVNDYDGVFQRLRLEEGPHHIEIREPGFEPLEFDVLILPGETITYEGYLVPLP